MNVKAALVGTTIALAPLALPAPAYAGSAQGLSCALASNVLTGGPAVLSGELAVNVDYWCTVRVTTPTGYYWAAQAHFSMPGTVAYLPPTPVNVSAVPGRDRVDVCTGIDWYFGFPGGGSIGFGCRPATYMGTLGWVAPPQPLV